MPLKILSFLKDAFSHSRCVVCGNIIIGAYCMDQMGNKVCMQHKDQAARCLSCGCLCSKEKASYIGHGEFVCESCASHSPRDSDIEVISGYVRKTLSDVGIDGIPPFNLHRVELDVLQKSTGNSCEGFAQYDGVNSSIYVLKYLSRTCYASVLAHELLHLWQYKNGLSLRQDICEGFCNLGAYEVLKTICTQVAQARMTIMEKDSYPIYGGGFRKVKSLYDKGGWIEVIKIIKGTKS